MYYNINFSWSTCTPFVYKTYALRNPSCLGFFWRMNFALFLCRHFISYIMALGVWCLCVSYGSVMIADWRPLSELEGRCWSESVWSDAVFWVDLKGGIPPPVPTDERAFHQRHCKCLKNSLVCTLRSEKVIYSVKNTDNRLGTGLVKRVKAFTMELVLQSYKAKKTLFMLIICMRIYSFNMLSDSSFCLQCHIYIYAFSRCFNSVEEHKKPVCHLSTFHVDIVWHSAVFVCNSQTRWTIDNKIHRPFTQITAWLLWHQMNQANYIYIYAFSRRFYPKRLSAFRLYIFYLCSLGIEPTTFCAANAMLYHWSTGTHYREVEGETAVFKLNSGRPRVRYS